MNCIEKTKVALQGGVWSLDILSRAFFNIPELTSRISRFAPDQLTQATGKSKLPSQGTAPISPLLSRAQFLVCFGAGQQDSSGYSLAKEEWTRHQVNGLVPLTGADGVVRSTSNNWWLERTTPSAPAKEASPLFLNGRSHPSFAKEGSFCSKKTAQMSKLQSPPLQGSCGFGNGIR